MSMQGVFELKKAVFAKLTADATLMAAVTGIYDHVSAETSYPFVVIGKAEYRDSLAIANNGLDIALNIDIYVRESGSKIALDIAGKVYDLLHEASLSLDSYKLIRIRFDKGETELKNDGITYHSNNIFRAIVEV